MTSVKNNWSPFSQNVLLDSDNNFRNIKISKQYIQHIQSYTKNKSTLINLHYNTSTNVMD